MEEVIVGTINSAIIVFISGSNCVGKTTIARNILQNHPEFIVIQNVDILREIVRSTYNEFDLYNGNFTLLNKSASELTYDKLLLQTEILLPSIISTCKRLKNKQISAIIEGIDICYESLFKNDEFQQFTKEYKNIIFVNLFLSDRNEHYKRIANRNVDSITKEKQLKNFENIRNTNDIMNSVVNKLNKQSKSSNELIINIDTLMTDSKMQSNIDRITSIIETKF